MVDVVDRATGVPHRLVFELRYERGELFWDRCGRIARTLDSQEGWAPHSIDTNGCHIRNEDDNTVFSFSATSLSLSQSQSRDVEEVLPAERFAAIAEQFSEAVVGGLEVDTFPRMGFRLWTLFPTASLDDAASRVSRMTFFSPCQAIADLGQLSYVSHTVVIERSARMIRVAVTPFEQQVNLAPSLVAAARARAREHWGEQKKVLIQKLKARKTIRAYPAQGIMLDMDAYLEDLLSMKQIPVVEFITTSAKEFRLIARAILVEADKQ